MIIYTEGTFDLLHYGHLNFLRQCKQLAGQDGLVIVGVNSDEFTTKYKGQPILNLDERCLALEGCKYVDKVYRSFRGATNAPQILENKPDIVAVGSDWAKKDIYKQYGLTPEWFEEQGILLVYLPYTETISATEIKERIKKWLS
jgi:glycerol-3-phosphate cytidylyltransferase